MLKHAGLLGNLDLIIGRWRRPIANYKGDDCDELCLEHFEAGNRIGKIATTTLANAAAAADAVTFWAGAPVFILGMTSSFLCQKQTSAYLA